MVKALYVHIPFCNSICGYCDFTRVKCNPRLIERYLDTLQIELQERIKEQSLETIYIGGGTPSALSSQQLKRLLIMLSVYSDNVKEYTVELNPETMNEEKVALLAKYAINRVSIGVQSIDEQLLNLMHRKHTWKQVCDLVKLLRKYNINNISMDCLYSVPNQSMQQLLETLHAFISLDINHISMYSLTIEENSAFARENFQKLEDEIEEAMYFEAVKLLQSNNYHQYEISNFSKEGFESMHNLHYWHYHDFYGIGLGASGKIGNMRYDNTTNFIDYFNKKWIANEVLLNKDDKLFEALMMNLRIKEGFNLINFNSQFEISLLDYYNEAFNIAIAKGWLFIDENYIRCSEIGYPLLHEVLTLFIKDN